MKKVRILCYIVMSLLVSSCAQQNYLQKSVWINTVEAKAIAEPAILITSLEFLSETDVEMYYAVVDNDGIAVKSFKYAEGKYTITKSNKGEDVLNIDVTNIKGEKLQYRGISKKNKAIILESNDAKYI